jgi:hypothetical protein
VDHSVRHRNWLSVVERPERFDDHVAVPQLLKRCPAALLRLAINPQERGLACVEPIRLYFRNLHVAAESIHRLRSQPGRNCRFRAREHNQKQNDGANSRHLSAVSAGYRVTRS